MPIYEFNCQACDHNFEELVLSSREVVVCPKCAGDKCEKLMSASSFVSKGGNGRVESRSAGAGSSCGSCSSSNCGTCGG